MPQPNRNASEPDLRRTGIHPDFWYPLARSRSLRRGRALGVSFAGEPIALVRTDSGKLFALEDRCAHRQIPLSLGVVSGERLQCCYHAWEYDATGRIARIPYLANDGPRPPRCVRGYPCREAYGHVFVFPGDSAKAATVPVPDLPSWNHRDFRTMYFSRQVPCHYSFMHENLMDMNHQFLHRKLLGKIKPTLLGSSRGDSWVEGRYRFESVGGRKKAGAGFLMKGSDRRATATSDHDIMTIRTDYPYQTLSLRRAGDTEAALQLWAVYVPVDAEQRSHRSFGMLMVKKPPVPGLVYLLWPFMRWFAERVFEEDRRAVIAEQRAHDAQGADWNHEVFPVILDLRDVLLRNGMPPRSAGE